MPTIHVPTIHWTEAGTTRSARWLADRGTPPPDRVVPADDRTRADTAYRLARAGTALLWRGDYPNARQLLRALARRVDRDLSARAGRGPGDDPADAFHRYRRARAHRARVLARLLVPLDDGYRLHLRRAPDVERACTAAYGPPDPLPGSPERLVVSLTELLGVVGADQWRVTGVPVPALGARIHPHYGVFSPVRGEYVDLVAGAPLPAAGRGAFDLGTGTGVLAAVLARRGVDHVTATDINPRALACARDNAHRLGLDGRVTVTGPGLFPAGRAGLVVCNPPWLPVRAGSMFERGVYDPGGRTLRAVLTGLTAHLEPGGEGWLVLSDLAERLGLRTRAGLLAGIAAAGLRVVDRTDTRPAHPRASDPADPLHAARVAEVVSLWRLAPP